MPGEQGLRVRHWRDKLARAGGYSWGLGGRGSRGEAWESGLPWGQGSGLGVQKALKKRGRGCSGQEAQLLFGNSHIGTLGAEAEGLRRVGLGLRAGMRRYLPISSRTS